MKYISIIFLIFCIQTGFSQSSNNFKLTYSEFGLGSNNGDSSQILSIENSQLRAKVFSWKLLTSLLPRDTIDKEYFIYKDTIFINEKLDVKLRESTIDSIQNILMSDKIKYVNTNLCIKSGALHQIDISSDVIGQKQFRLYNTFDSTALEISDLILKYYPKNYYEFRPLHEWNLDLQCEEYLIRKRVQQKENTTDKPVDRKKLIEKTIKNELEIKEQH